MLARSLGLQRETPWHEWSKSGSRPADIPSHPEQTYAQKGWKSWGHWLGTTSGQPSRKRHRAASVEESISSTDEESTSGSDEESADEEFVVERIVESRQRLSVTECLVKWEGYPDTDNTWEPALDLPSNLVAAFMAPAPRKATKRSRAPVNGATDPAKQVPIEQKTRFVSSQVAAGNKSESPSDSNTQAEDPKHCKKIKPEVVMCKEEIDFYTIMSLLIINVYYII